MAEDNNQEKGREPERLPGQSEEEQYSFIQENVKKSPKNKKRIFGWLLGVVCGGLAFGAISGLAFRAVSTQNGAETEVSFDDESQTEMSEKNESDASIESDVSESAVAAAAESSSESLPEISAEEKTPEELAEEAADEQISNFLLLRQRMTEIAEEPARAMVTISRISSTEDWFDTVNEKTVSGSGIIIADSGSNLIILTTQSLAEGDGRLVATFCDGSVYDAQLRKSDAASGLSTVVVQRNSISQETLEACSVAVLGNSADVTVGEPVIAIGSPIGYSNSMEFGEVTAVSKSVSVSDSLYTQILTNMYSPSGSGALIDLNGQVVGIIVSELNDDDESLIKALAVSPIKMVITKLSNDTEIGYLGIYGDNITEQLSSQTGLPVGVYVTGVDENSPAYGAGIQPGDIITAIDGDEVLTMDAYHRILMSCSAGDALSVTIQRLAGDGYAQTDFTMTVEGR